MPAGAASLPFAATIESRVLAAATGDATLDTVIGVAGAAGAIVSVTFTPDAAVTGANTNSFTSSVVNKGQAGAGTLVPATRAFVSGQNLVAFDEATITLSVTAADLEVAAGDVIAWRRTLVGTGLATPAGLVRVRIGAA